MADVDLDALDRDVEAQMRAADVIIVDAIKKLNELLTNRQALADLEHGAGERRHYFERHAKLMAMHQQLMDMT